MKGREKILPAVPAYFQAVGATGRENGGAFRRSQFSIAAEFNRLKLPRWGTIATTFLELAAAKW
ncbi:MAG TPA: hypothetical protein V6C85_23245 [Allocoleopsis sp.]